MNKIFSKFSLLITIGLLSILFFTDYTFAQGPGNALDFNGDPDPDSRYGFVNAPNAPPLNMTNQITIEAWFKPSSSSWAYKKLITIDYTKVSATLIDFPVLVSVTDADLKDSENGGQIQPDGDDILFIMTDGTKLSHEIEKYDGTTGQLKAWVKIPSLSSSTDTEFYLHYSNSTCSSQQDAINVWDSDYQGVWHLEESGDGSVDEYRDGTTNSNHGQGGNGDTSMVPTQITSGKISNAQDFDGIDDFVSIGDILNGANGVTLSAWVKHDNLTTTIERYIDLSDNAVIRHDGQTSVGQLHFFIRTGGGTARHIRVNGVLKNNTWYHVAGTWDGTEMKVYLNGAVRDSLTPPAGALDEPATSLISNTSETMDGVIDEVRVSSTARDSSWIGTEYRNQNSPETFMSFSNQTAAGISKSLAYGISTNNSKVFGTINNQSVSGSINASEWNHISLTYDKDAGGTDEIKLYLNGTQSATGDYSTAISTNSNNLLLGDMVGFIGKMDEIRLWNEVRTQMEIRENMHITLTPESEPSLVAYWKLDESSGTLVVDSKGSNDGTLMNMNDTNRVASTAAFGGGIVNSTTGFTSGTINSGTFSLTTTEAFDNPVDIIATEILNAPNILPSVVNPLDDRYWVVEVYGTPGTYTANVTFTLPAGYLELGDEANLILYNRTNTSDSSWSVLISGASSMTLTTVTFDGVRTLGQFTIGSTTGSPLPVELLSFTGTVKNQKVYLNWSTASEANNNGFKVQRKVSSKSVPVGETGNWTNIGFVDGFGNSNSQMEYNFIDSEINSAGIYYYRLKQIDYDGTYEFSNQIEVNFNLPNNIELSQNYPNPFNPSTTISFNLPESGKVILKIYNIIGVEIKTLVDGYKEAGIYTVKFNAEEHPSGMYLYTLNTNGFTETKKMLLMK